MRGSLFGITFHCIITSTTHDVVVVDKPSYKFTELKKLNVLQLWLILLGLSFNIEGVIDSLYIKGLVLPQ